MEIKIGISVDFLAWKIKLGKNGEQLEMRLGLGFWGNWGFGAWNCRIYWEYKAYGKWLFYGKRYSLLLLRYEKGRSWCILCFSNIPLPLIFYYFAPTKQPKETVQGLFKTKGSPSAAVGWCCFKWRINLENEFEGEPACWLIGRQKGSSSRSRSPLYLGAIALAAPPHQTNPRHFRLQQKPLHHQRWSAHLPLRSKTFAAVARGRGEWVLKAGEYRVHEAIPIAGQTNGQRKHGVRLVKGEDWKLSIEGLSHASRSSPFSEDSKFVAGIGQTEYGSRGQSLLAEPAQLQLVPTRTGKLARTQV